MTKIDWNAPLDAYHPDGRVVEVEIDHDDGPYPDGWGEYNVCYFDGCEGTPWFDAETGKMWGNEWQIRNRTEKPALTEEMVREAMHPYVDGPMYGRVITLLREHGVLAEPVEDADLVMAREVAAECDYLHEAAYKAIKRVRAEGAGG